MTDTETTVRDELAAMRRIVAALDQLDTAARDRIVGWLFDRYRLPAESDTAQTP